MLAGGSATSTELLSLQPPNSGSRTDHSETRSREVSAALGPPQWCRNAAQGMIFFLAEQLGGGLCDTGAGAWLGFPVPQLPGAAGGRDKGLRAAVGKGGPSSLQIPLLIAELISELWWGAQRKLQSLLSRKENDHMEGVVRAGGRGQRELWHSGICRGVGHRARGLKSDIQIMQLVPGCFSCLF